MEHNEVNKHVSACSVTCDQCVQEDIIGVFVIARMIPICIIPDVECFQRHGISD